MAYRIKKLYLLIFISVTMLASCSDGHLNTPLVYDRNPQYTWGYAEFFGNYYANYGNKNSVLSISLYTDSLKINSLGNLTGYGQYLFLEDVFQTPTDTILQAGTYTVNNSGLPFTVAPGRNVTVDGEVYPIGAYISYYELNSANSTMKLISRGSFTVSYSGDIYSIACNFITSDSLNLKGSFKATLPQVNQSTATQKLALRRRFVPL